MQGGPGRRGHMTKLPADLLTDSVLLVGSGETSCLGGIRRSTQGVCAHMGNTSGPPRGSGGCRCCGSGHVTSGAATDKSAADLLGDIKLATSEGSRPGDRGHGAGHPLELPPRTTPAPALRSPLPTPRRSAGRLRSASAETPYASLPRTAPRAEAPDDLDCVLKRPASTNTQNSRPLRIGRTRLLLLAGFSSIRRPLLLLVREHLNRTDQSPGLRGTWGRSRTIASLFPPAGVARAHWRPGARERPRRRGRVLLAQPTRERNRACRCGAYATCISRSEAETAAVARGCRSKVCPGRRQRGVVGAVLLTGTA